MRPTTILLVEDETAICDILMSVLEDEGYRVITANDGEQAIATLGKTRLDLVVLDMMMPLVEGREVLQHIRATDGIRELPVILMSASPLPSIEGESYSLFLRKPFDLQTLLDEVARLLPRKHSGEVLRGVAPARLSPPT